jgi:hypothetical protein
MKYCAVHVPGAWYATRETGKVPGTPLMLQATTLPVVVLVPGITVDYTNLRKIKAT